MGSGTWRDRQRVHLLFLACLLSPSCSAVFRWWGGWDVDALHSELPALGHGAPNRIGDLTPYPALVGDALALVVCRFEEANVVRIEVEGDDWPEEWSHRALPALGFDGVRLELAAAGDVNFSRSWAADSRAIDCRAGGVGACRFGGYLGRMRCLLGNRTGWTCFESKASDRGSYARVTIRLRRRLRQQTGKVFEASEAEWGAAFLHELAHGLGFAGHVATGESRRAARAEWLAIDRAERRRGASDSDAEP